MGLDMYLNRRTYVKRWSHQSKEKQFNVSVKKGGKKHPYIKPKNISYVIEEVGYWRKANHIHKWFVNNVQSNNDDCEEYYVNLEQLEKLKAICEEVVKIFDKADKIKKKGKDAFGTEYTYNEYKNLDIDSLHELLPTQSGLFFGGTAYNDWYLSDCVDTIKILDECLKDANDESFTSSYYYESSW